MSKFTEPELLADDNHGVYCSQLAYKDLLPYLKQQIKDKIGEESVKVIEEGPDCEWHWDAVNDMEGVELTTEEGVKFYIQSMEGGVWAVPVSYMDTEEYEQWCGC